MPLPNAQQTLVNSNMPENAYLDVLNVSFLLKDNNKTSIKYVKTICLNMKAWDIEREEIGLEDLT